MELVSRPTTEFLLDASLETLHAQSREWLSEVDFWNEEMTFFYKLLRSKGGRASFPSESVANIEKELIRISSDVLGNLRKDLDAHERALGATLRNNALHEDSDYRERHKSLVNSMYNAQEIIRKFKKDVFSFVQ